MCLQRTAARLEIERYNPATGDVAYLTFSIAGGPTSVTNPLTQTQNVS